MDLNDRGFQQFYVSKGVTPGQPTKKSVMEGLWQEYQGAKDAQESDTARAQSLLSPLPEGQAPSAAPRPTDVPEFSLISSPKQTIQDKFESLPAVATQPEETEVPIDSPEWANELARIEATQRGGARKAHYQAAGVDSVMAGMLENREGFKSRADYEEYKNNILKTVPGIGIVENLESRSAKLDELKQTIKDPEQVIRLEKLNRANPTVDPIALYEKAISSQTSSEPLSPERVKQGLDLQTYVDNNLKLASETQDPQQKQIHETLAAQGTAKLRALNSTPAPTLYDETEQIRKTLAEIQQKKESGGLGTVVYGGVAVPVAQSDELQQNLLNRQADLRYKLQTDPEARASLRVSLKNAEVFETDKNGKPKLGVNGEPVLNQKATIAKLNEMRSKAALGEMVEQDDGTVGPFMGVKDTKEIGSLVPDPLKPAIKGAGVIAEKISNRVAPLLTEDNIAMASNLQFPGMMPGPAVKLAFAAARDPKRATAKAIRAGYEFTSPMGFLAMKGLDYLSAVGQKAEEEEKKKRAGQ